MEIEPLQRGESAGSLIGHPRSLIGWAGDTVLGWKGGGMDGEMEG